MAKERAMTRVGGLVALAVFFAVLPGQTQTVNQAGGRQAAEEKPEEGIPLTAPLVIAKCGTCHTKDEKGNLSRISWERSTPEGWEESIKRMVRLNGLRIAPPHAKAILKYFSTNHAFGP